MNQEMRTQLTEQCGAMVRFDEPMARHTTMQVGGTADAWVEPENPEALQAVLHFAKVHQLPWCAVGRGSNLLVRDGGIRGVVIHLGRMQDVQIEDASAAAPGANAVLQAQAGVKLKRLLGFCAEQGWSGLEGLEGVPGTVGGAIMMNAGTPAGAIGDAVADVTYIERGERLVTKTAAQLAFAYRTSKMPRTAVVVATRLRVTRSTPDQVRARLQALRTRREAAQPVTKPGVGSVFRNPPQGSAWTFIDEAGLRGVRIGQARVSEQHANWIVNEGGATARDVETLIRLMRDRVKEKCGILLEPEVVIVGEE